MHPTPSLILSGRSIIGGSTPHVPEKAKGKLLTLPASALILTPYKARNFRLSFTVSSTHEATQRRAIRDIWESVLGVVGSLGGVSSCTQVTLLELLCIEEARGDGVAVEDTTRESVYGLYIHVEG